VHQSSRFVPGKFEELFCKHALTHPHSLTSNELMGMLKANRVPKDYFGWYNIFLCPICSRGKKLEHFSLKEMQKLTLEFIAGWLAGQNGRSCTFCARTRMVCCTKTQSKLFMMEACLNAWRRKHHRLRRKCINLTIIYIYIYIYIYR
jgi:hypothetical protein